jgi:hypothetical protein
MAYRSRAEFHSTKKEGREIFLPFSVASYPPPGVGESEDTLTNLMNIQGMERSNRDCVGCASYAPCELHPFSDNLTTKEYSMLTEIGKDICSFLIGAGLIVAVLVVLIPHWLLS